MNDPVPETDQGSWLERNQLLGEYLPRIGAAPDFMAQKALACELASKLFDSWAERRVRQVKLPADIAAFETDEHEQARLIERTYLSDVAMFTLVDNSVSVTIAGRKRHWLAEAVRRCGMEGSADGELPGATNQSKSELATNRGVIAVSGSARTPPSAPLILATAEDRKAAVQAYIDEVWNRTGNRITKTDIWRKARYKSRTEFERWERKDPKATKAAHHRFSRLLGEKPHLN